MDAFLKIRQDDPDAEAVPQCDGENAYDGRLGVRVSAIFVILFSSLLGALLPVVLARARRISVPPAIFFVAKYIGTGVIIATAFMHLLVPAFEALGNDCLTPYGLDEYPWAGGICFMTVMLMFFMEIIISHYDIFSGAGHDHSSGAIDPSLALLKKQGGSASLSSSTPAHDVEMGTTAKGESVSSSNLPGEDHLGHSREHTENDSAFAAQMTGLFILEFGIIFHSIFIGLTLAVTGDEFNVLYIVLVFHQMFEGMGLGSRLATAHWPRDRAYMPYLLACAFALSTPVAIAIGLGVRDTLQPGSATTLVVNGVFDAISAGILLYTGLVELMAHEFMFSPQMQKATIGVKLSAIACVFSGGGLMALLAKWA